MHINILHCVKAVVNCKFFKNVRVSTKCSIYNFQIFAKWHTKCRLGKVDYFGLQHFLHCHNKLRHSHIKQKKVSYDNFLLSDGLI